jgi:hypothetical protein
MAGRLFDDFHFPAARSEYASGYYWYIFCFDCMVNKLVEPCVCFSIVK